jgi:hypothetical protein
MQRTEDEFLNWRQHVDGKGHLILVDLEAHPADDSGNGPDDYVHYCGVIK